MNLTVLLRSRIAKDDAVITNHRTVRYVVDAEQPLFDTTKEAGNNFRGFRQNRCWHATVVNAEVIKCARDAHPQKADGTETHLKTP